MNMSHVPRHSIPANFALAFAAAVAHTVIRDGVTPTQAAQ
jgi:hypothetical protein